MNYFLYILWLLSWGIAFLFGQGDIIILLLAIHGTICLIGALVVGYLKDLREIQEKASSDQNASPADQANV